MRHALIKDGEIINFIEYDGLSEYCVPGDHHLVLAEDNVQYGHTYQDGSFIAPPESEKIDTSAQDNEEHNRAIIKELKDIDGKKIRAITDYILTGDAAKLNALETHAEMLRGQIRKV